MNSGFTEDIFYLPAFIYFKGVTILTKGIMLVNAIVGAIKDLVLIRPFDFLITGMDIFYG